MSDPPSPIVPDPIGSEPFPEEEQEFEEALLALNLDDIVAQAQAAKNETENSEEGTCTREEADNDVDQSQEGGISDEALMQAVQDNPDLFQ